jgi:ABC-2 type transport system permease protein
MQWHRLIAMARKEMLQIVRDVRSLSILVVMPLILILLFGYGVNLDLRHIPIAVFDREGSQRSQDLLKRFAASEYFEVRAVLSDYAGAVEAIDYEHAKMVLVIPHDFSVQLDHGTARVQALVDATDDNTANLILGYTEGVVQSYSQEMQLDWLHKKGQSKLEPPLRVESRTWFNEDLESKAFIVPGVIAIVMAVMGAFLTSLTIAREWERGTMEQLVSTPVLPLEVMLGKLAPYFVIGMVDTALCAGVGVLWFDVPFRGQWTTLFGASALFLVVVLSQGYFISVVAKNQLAASQAALVSTFLPAFLLSGFLFSIEQMPGPLQVFTRIVPARYYVSLLKKVFLKGSAVEFLMAELVALAIFSLILASLATRAFHKRLA